MPSLSSLQVRGGCCGQLRCTPLRAQGGLGRSCRSKAASLVDLPPLPPPPPAAAASPHASALWGFEISNEVVPNTITPAAWSADAERLSAAAAPLFAAAGLPPPPFAGPAQGGCSALGGVASTIAKGVLGALTYHQYPECLAADPSFTLTPSCLGNLDAQATGCVAAAEPAPGPPFPAVWAGETADHSGGGIPGLTDTFRSSFYYAWQLGALPLSGVELGARQCLSGGDYELLQVSEGRLCFLLGSSTSGRRLVCLATVHPCNWLHQQRRPSGLTPSLIPLQRGSFDPNPDYWIAWL
jgi:hypothetical protein